MTAPPPQKKPHEALVPDMPGHKAEGELAKLLRREVADMLGRPHLGFPGAQPVSFCRRHIDALKREECAPRPAGRGPPPADARAATTCARRATASAA